MYMLWLGRWLSPNPVGTRDGLKGYCYGNNDSVNYSDLAGPVACYAGAFLACSEEIGVRMAAMRSRIKE